jgi:hypothetical protein
LLLWTAFWLSRTVLAGAQPDAAQQDALQQVRERYGAAEWKKGPRYVGFPLASLEIPGWTGGPLRSDAGHLRRKFVANGDAVPAPAILVGAYVGDSAEAAHRQVLNWLAGFQSPDMLPRAEELDLRMGDVAFLGISREKIPVWIGLARGNIAMFVANTDSRAHPQLDLTAIAIALDKVAASQKQLDSEGELPVPKIERFVPATSTVKAGEVVPLDLTISDPAGGVPHVQWVVGGPGQGYVQARDGAWYLHTTKAGTISLTVEVTASTGTFSSRKASILVEPRRR